MDRHRFDSEVRPTLTEIPIGQRGIAFDRHELDAWADAYIAACGRPSREPKGAQLCELGREVSSWPMTAGGSSTRNTRDSGSSNGSAPSARTTPRPGLPPGKRRSTRNGQTAFDAAVTACGQMLHGST